MGLIDENSYKRILITGDTHGMIDFNKLREYPFKEGDLLIILGDAGIYWSDKYNYISNYEALGVTILFVDGNHENYTFLNNLPETTVFNAKAGIISKNIFRIKRGEILNIFGTTFLCMGGAHSDDRMYRVKNISYWEEEEITEQDYQNALKNLAKVNYCVDCVFSHCAPSFINDRYAKPSKSADYLSLLQSKILFNRWFFGHYHYDDDKYNLPYVFLYNFINEYNINPFPYRNDFRHQLTSYDPDNIGDNYFPIQDYAYEVTRIVSIKILGDSDNSLDKGLFFMHMSLELLYDDEEKYKVNEVDICGLIKQIDKFNHIMDATPLKREINDYVKDLYNKGYFGVFTDFKYPEVFDKAQDKSKYLCVNHLGDVMMTFNDIDNAKKYAENIIKIQYQCEFECKSLDPMKEIVYKLDKNNWNIKIISNKI